MNICDIKIEGPDKKAMEAAKQRVDSLSKPIGSLGRLEEYAVRLAGIRGYTGGAFNKKAVLVFAADNGIHAQGITPVPKVVTLTQTLNIASGIAGVSVLARQAGAEVFVFDVGVEPEFSHPNVANCKVMPGTKDMAEGPAMTRGQCEKAMDEGFDAVAKNMDCDLLGIGEMGICNTSSAAAVATVLLGERVEDMTGRGAGITDDQLAKKTEVIQQAIKINNPSKNDTIDVLSKVGGLDIAAMAGAYIGAAHHKIPVVVDGYISACAALCAAKIAPESVDYMFASHKSQEPGYMRIINALNMQPALDLQMRLGEGSGCPLMFNVLEAALHIAEEMGTFAEGNINAEGFVDIR